MQNRYGKLAVAAVAVVVSLTSLHALAGDYYVDGNTGLPGNGGTSWGDAKDTIAGAFALLPASGSNTIHVRGDAVYREAIGVNKGGLSDTERLVFQGEPGTGAGEQPIISLGRDLNEAGFAPTNGYANTYWISDATGVSAMWEAGLASDSWTAYASLGSIAAVDGQARSFYYDGAAQVLFVRTSNSTHPNNFQLEANSASHAFNLLKSYTSVVGFQIRHGTYSVRISGTGPGNVPSYCNIISNRCYNSVDDGMYIYYTSGAVIDGNTVHDNGDRGIFPLYCEAPMVRDNTCYANGLEAIEFIYGNNYTACLNTCYSNGLDGIHADPHTDNQMATIYSNTCYLNPNNGIRIPKGTNCLVYGNACYSNGNYGIYFGSGSTVAEGFVVSNNTVFDNAWHGIEFHNSDNAVICDNTVYGHSPTYSGVSAEDGTNNTVRGNTCYGNRRGVQLSYADYSMAISNTCRHNTEHGVYSQYTPGAAAWGNTCYSNSDHGVYIFGSSANKVCDNTCFDNGVGATDRNILISSSPNTTVYGNTTHGGKDGIWVAGSTNCFVANNTCYDSGTDAAGIFIHTGNADTRLYNNVVYGNVYGIYVFQSPRAVVCNNSIYGNSSSELIIQGDSSNAVVFNNAVYETGSGKAIAVGGDAGSYVGFQSDHNDFYAPVGFVGSWLGNRTTLAQWQSASGQDANSTSADPGFVDTGSTPSDLHITLASPCFAAGTPSFAGENAATNDIDGMQRPFANNFDIGADEVRYEIGTVVGIR